MTPTERSADYRRRRPEAYKAYQKEYSRKNRKRIRARARQWYADNPEKAASTQRDRRLVREYGITSDQYNLMVKRQNGVCAICGHPPKTRRLAVEHDHKTKRVRGLACHLCNKHRIGNNTVETAKRVLAYLESDFDGRKL